MLQGGVEAGAEALAQLAPNVWATPPRRPVSKSTTTSILQRDHFTCRYCNGKTIFVPVMELLGVVYPEEFPFLGAGRRGRLTHEAVIARSAAVDHVLPVAYGGDNSHNNLVTACNPCNSMKAELRLEFLGWELQPTADSNWDGLTRFYVHLWEIAEVTDKAKERYHRSWMRGLGLL